MRLLFMQLLFMQLWLMRLWRSGIARIQPAFNAGQPETHYGRGNTIDRAVYTLINRLGTEYLRIPLAGAVNIGDTQVNVEFGIKGIGRHVGWLLLRQLPK